jgi:RNA-binding motif X-linked protein 2
MNQIRAIQALNKREIENGVPPEASWHVDYRDTAFVNFGGLPYEMSEGDVITIFSQFGEPVFLKLVRDKETGQSKGFGWLKYEDQRSTDLAVDNLGGAEIGGRLIRVDHARYQMRDDEDIDEYKIGWEDTLRRERAEKGLPSEDEDETDAEEAQRARPMIKEERELQLLIQNHDDDDPMKEYLVDEKKKEVEEALRREKRRSEKGSRKHGDKDRHRHRSHRSRRDDSGDEGRDKDKYRSRDDRDADKKERRSRRDETTAETRRGDGDDERRRRRHRDSPGRDRSREGRSGRDRERKEEPRRRGGPNEDDHQKDADRPRRHTREGSRDRGERRHRDLEDRRRDQPRSRSRSPR